MSLVRRSFKVHRTTLARLIASWWPPHEDDRAMGLVNGLAYAWHTRSGPEREPGRRRRGTQTSLIIRPEVIYLLVLTGHPGAFADCFRASRKSMVFRSKLYEKWMRSSKRTR
jgi:hypothetical protein